MKRTYEEINSLRLASQIPQRHEFYFAKGYRLCEQEKDAEIERLTKELQSAKEKLRKLMDNLFEHQKNTEEYIGKTEYVNAQFELITDTERVGQ